MVVALVSAPKPIILIKQVLPALLVYQNVLHVIRQHLVHPVQLQLAFMLVVVFPLAPIIFIIQYTILMVVVVVLNVYILAINVTVLLIA